MGDGAGLTVRGRAQRPLRTVSLFASFGGALHSDGLRVRTKTGDSRTIVVPIEARAVLEVHGKQQAEFRRHFGPDYRTNLDLIFCTPEGSLLNPDS